jgi:CheY-like chemotaxis protein
MAFRILVVEDNTDHRDLITRMLEIEGYTIFTAQDGDEGLEQVKAECPDLIICDVMMPRVDGLQMVRALRGMPEGSPIPVLMITAYGDVREDAIKAGADRTMGKPFDFDELIKVVKEMLAQSPDR